MKEIALLRHAKSAWPEDGRPDQERPLSRRGKRDAVRIGEMIRDQALLPDLVITSPAKRARATGKRMVKAWPTSVPIQVEPALYQAGPLACLQALARLSDGVQRVLVVGHNPTFEEMVALLTGHRVALATATLALVSVPIRAWSELATAPRGTLQATLRPGEQPTYLGRTSSGEEIDAPRAHDIPPQGEGPGDTLR